MSANVGAHVGRAVHSDQVVNVNSGEIWLSLDPAADYEATVAAVERVLAATRVCRHDVLTYPEDRITDVLPGTATTSWCGSTGEDHASYRPRRRRCAALLSGIDGIERPTVEVAPTEPTLEIEVDLARPSATGSSRATSDGRPRPSLSGLAVGNLFEEQKVFDVVVWGTPEIRQT